MKVRMYTLFDKGAKMYLEPMCFRTEAEAKRTQKMQIAKYPESAMAQYPMDYDLVFLGEYNQVSGEMDQITDGINWLCPDHVCSLEQLMNQKPIPLNLELEQVPENKKSGDLHSNPVVEMEGEIDEQDRKEKERRSKTK